MGNKLTEKEIHLLIKKTNEYTSKGLRLGQSYMNALSDINKKLYLEITNTKYDPFYNNNNIINFFTYLKK
jgi:hypothetical protein